MKRRTIFILSIVSCASSCFAANSVRVPGLSEVMPDHVHLFVDVIPQFVVHNLMKCIKGRTSRILRQEFPHLTTQLPTLWTNSYFVSAVCGAPLAIVKKYIERQKTSQR